jgi:hypothetical protein
MESLPYSFPIAVDQRIDGGCVDDVEHRAAPARSEFCEALADAVGARLRGRGADDRRATRGQDARRSQRPIPREAPVTSATSSGQAVGLEHVHPRLLRSSVATAASFRLAASAMRNALERRRDPLRQAGQHAPRSTFDHVRHALGRHLLDRLDPAYRADAAWRASASTIRAAIRVPPPRRRC